MNELLNLIADDRGVISYRKELNKITGSVTATILLQQFIFRNKHSKNESFYKFIEPCNHNKYVEGDSWTEELGFTKYEFNTAYKKLESLNIVSKKTNRDRVTFYTLNSVVLAKLIKPLYQSKENQLTKSENTNLDTYTENTRDNTENIKNKQKEKSTPKKSLDISAIENHLLKDEVLEFIEHRKDIKKPFTQLAFKKFINLVDNFISQNLDVVDMMNKSITAGYPTIYQPKANIVSNNQNKRPVYESMEDKNTRLINEAFDMANNIENGQNDIIDTEIL